MLFLRSKHPQPAAGSLTLLYQLSTILAPDQFTVTTVPNKIIRLLAMDLTNKIEEDEDQSAELDFDDDEGDDDWEDEEDGRSREQFAFLSDVIDSHGLDTEGDEEEEADPDIMADPIYQLNMKVK